MKRSGKFYRKNEAEIMKLLGLKPTKNSGSGWIEKEDGQSEDIICQLKSTDAQSIKINLSDLHTLEYNSSVAHKLPVFAIQFLQSNEVFLIIKPENLEDASNYIKTGEIDESHFDLDIDKINELEDKTTQVGRMIKSSSNAREKYKREQQKKYSKKEKSAI